MDDKRYPIEPYTIFSKSLLWQLNRDYYQNTGIAAWSEGVVPHHMTSNSFVAKVYAELILGFLKDLSRNKNEKVYILELGAGHGRLAFHILNHLIRLISLEKIDLPPFCYILSDIVEENLNFFLTHPQFENYLDSGLLEVAYYDAISSQNLELRNSGEIIDARKLGQPMVVIANYFFDSIPSDLFYVKDQELSICSVELESDIDPTGLEKYKLLENLKANFKSNPVNAPIYNNPVLEPLLNDYKNQLSESYFFFPATGLECLERLKKFSTQGLFLLTMDKGFHELHDLDKKKEPEVITHGSLSFWVNFDAIGKYCNQEKGTALYPAFSSFYLQMACFLFLKNGSKYKAANAAFQRYVNDFGPDDFNGMKRLVYQNISRLNLKDLIMVLRLSHYDSTLFERILPRLKQVCRQITFNERKRIGETLHFIWDGYFYINETFDLAYEIAGLFYDLGFYEEAIVYFEHSIKLRGAKPDSYYNIILSHYQLRQDEQFSQALKTAKTAFPDYSKFEELLKLDLNAI